MTSFLFAYPFLVLTIVALDLLWLGVVMKDFYRANLGHLMGDSVVWGAAIAFYFLFAAGLLYFAVMPAVETASLVRAISLGALIGFLSYATYDLTNHATLRDWPLIVTIVDIAWGAVLSATAAGVGFLAVKILGSF